MSAVDSMRSKRVRGENRHLMLSYITNTNITFAIFKVNLFQRDGNLSVQMDS